MNEHAEPPGKYRTRPVPSTRMPAGIPYIVGNEAAERFSFYGMKTILLVFMTEYLMGIGTGTRAVMDEARAEMWVHVFTGAAYFSPIIGGIIADRYLGKYTTIMSVSILYCLGHLALALDHSRIGLTVGLTLIAMGSGGIKPCVTAHVGDQFGKTNQHLISRVFGWFYISINLGAFISSLLTPMILRACGPQLGPHFAFGLPGALMFLATFVFWLGRYKFVHIPPAGESYFRDTFGGEGLHVIVKLVPLYVFVAMFWSLFDQTASSWVVQARQMNRNLLGLELFPSQVQAANPLLILLLVPVFSYVVYPTISRVFPLTALRKVSIGLFVAALAFVVSALIETEITGGRVLSASSEEADGAWPKERLIDGTPDSGWVSERDPKFPQQIVLRLRERRPWSINSVQIDSALDLQPLFDELPDEERPTGDDASQRCWARSVDVWVGSTPREASWKKVGTLELEPTRGLQTLEFLPVEAEYVVLKVTANRGGKYVGLSEVRVIATAQQAPADAHAEAKNVWPDVAAQGERPNIAWQLLAYFLITSAEIMVSITCIEFSYTQAPNRMKSFIMSLYLLSVSAGNAVTAGVNWFRQNEDGTSKLEGVNFFWFFTACMLVTAVVFIFYARRYKEETHIQEE